MERDNERKTVYLASVRTRPPRPQPTASGLGAASRARNMAAAYKQRDLAQYVQEPIPSAEFKEVARSSHANHGEWSKWVEDLRGPLPQLTPASMLMPLVNALPPPDMRLPKPLQRLDPAVLCHFKLQAVSGAPQPATAIDGGPLPAQLPAATALREAAPSSLSGRSSADGSQKPASKSDRIQQLAVALFEARPEVRSGASPHAVPLRAPPPVPRTDPTVCRPGRANIAMAV